MSYRKNRKEKVVKAIPEFAIGDNLTLLVSVQTVTNTFDAGTEYTIVEIEYNEFGQVIYTLESSNGRIHMNEAMLKLSLGLSLTEDKQESDEPKLSGFLSYTLLMIIMLVLLMFSDVWR